MLDTAEYLGYVIVSMVKTLPICNPEEDADIEGIINI